MENTVAFWFLKYVSHGGVRRVAWRWGPQSEHGLLARAPSGRASRQDPPHQNSGFQLSWERHKKRRTSRLNAYFGLDPSGLQPPPLSGEDNMT